MSVPAPISIQLYTLREEAGRDFPAVLARLGEIGYRGVELAGLHGLTTDEVRRALDAADLEISAAHVPLPVGDDAGRIFDEQEALGCRDLVVAFLPPDRFESADGVRRVAEELNRANEAARARDLRLGYHNHWWELASRFEGETAHALLFRELDPSVFAEVDTYWAQVGGADPVKVVADLGPRVRFLHVKDGPADDAKSPMTAVGAGSLDVPAILGANPAVEWHVVELDRCATDMFLAVEQSHAYLVGSGLSQGKA